MGTQMDVQLRKSIKNIYRRANEYADEHGGIEYGMNILYGPPIREPSVMIVSAQGGGDDPHRQRIWPGRFVYLESEFQFGKRLVSDFADAGLSNVLKTDTVATNIAFPQFKGEFDRWLKKDGSKEWLDRSLTWVRQLAKLMPPKVVLTYGRHAFGHLVGREKSGGINHIEKDEWLGFPVVGCGHLMQGSTKAARDRAMELVREVIS